MGRHMTRPSDRMAMYVAIAFLSLLAMMIGVFWFAAEAGAFGQQSFARRALSSVLFCGFLFGGTHLVADALAATDRWVVAGYGVLGAGLMLAVFMHGLALPHLAIDALLGFSVALVAGAVTAQRHQRPARATTMDWRMVIRAMTMRLLLALALGAAATALGLMAYGHTPRVAAIEALTWLLQPAGIVLLLVQGALLIGLPERVRAALLPRPSWVAAGFLAFGSGLTAAAFADPLAWWPLMNLLCISLGLATSKGALDALIAQRAPLLVAA